MHKEDKIRLQHMRDAAQEAVAFASGRAEADLNTDRMRALALTHCFGVIGEAAAAVSPETRDAYPHVP